MNLIKHNSNLNSLPQLIPIVRWHMAFVGLLLPFFIGCSTDSASNRQTSKNQIIKSSNEDTKLQKKIVFFGNSLTAGYGLDEDEAFTRHIQTRLDSLGYDYVVVNAGLSGETTAGGDRRIDWVLQQDMDVFFLELGGNDMLRGMNVVHTKKNLTSIILKVRKKHPAIPILLAGMLAAPNLGKEYTTDFASIYLELASTYKLTFIPFFLEGVAGNGELNQSDGIHPNARGQRIVAKTVWKYLSPHLTKDDGTAQ